MASTKKIVLWTLGSVGAFFIILFVIMRFFIVNMVSVEMTDEKKNLIQNARFTTLDGNAVSVNDYKGKILVIDFWETWCKPCIAGMLVLAKLQREYPDELVIIAANTQMRDTPEKAKTFAKERNLAFTFVLAKELARELGIKAIPFKIVLDKEGNIIDTQSGLRKDGYTHLKELIEKHKDKQ